MTKYEFLYEETEENKNLWKAIKATEMTRQRLVDKFFKVTIIEETEEKLERVLDSNFDVISTIMA